MMAHVRYLFESMKIRLVHFFFYFLVGNLMKKPLSMSVKRAKILFVNFWSKPKKNVWMLMSVCNINGWLEITATKLWRLPETDFSLFAKRSGKNMPTGTSLYCPLAGWANSRLWENCKLRSTGCKKFWSTGSALHPGLSSNPNRLLLWKVIFYVLLKILCIFFHAFLKIWNVMTIARLFN